MKKLALVLLAVCSIATAYAQPHSILVYGNFSYSSNTQDYDQMTVQNWNWFLNPGVGYQLDKYWTIGIQGSFGQGSAPATTSLDQSLNTTDWAVGAFGRYTHSLGNVFSVYGQLDMSVTGGTMDMSENGTTLTPQASYSGFRASLYPAISANICRGFALNLNIGGVTYGSTTWTDHPSTLKSESKLNLDFGKVLTIGISKNFPTHHKMHGHHEPGDDTRHIDTSDDDDEAPKATTKKEKHSKKHGKKEKKSSKSKTKVSDDE